MGHGQGQCQVDNQCGSLNQAQSQYSAEGQGLYAGEVQNPSKGRSSSKS